MPFSLKMLSQSHCRTKVTSATNPGRPPCRASGGTYNDLPRSSFRPSSAFILASALWSETRPVVIMLSDTVCVIKERARLAICVIGRARQKTHDHATRAVLLSLGQIDPMSCISCGFNAFYSRLAELKIQMMDTCMTRLANVGDEQCWRLTYVTLNYMRMSPPDARSEFRTTFQVGLRILLGKRCSSLQVQYHAMQEAAEFRFWSIQVGNWSGDHIEIEKEISVLHEFWYR